MIEANMKPAIMRFFKQRNIENNRNVDATPSSESLIRSAADEPHPVLDNLFLSVGAQKCGTTWLYYLLNEHPDIYFTPEKELHYFAHVYTDEKPLTVERRQSRVKQKFGNLDTRANAARVQTNLRWYAGYLSDPVDDDWYRQMFSNRRGQKFCADFSNLTCHLNDADWAHVRGYAKTLKVIYIIRDPVQRLWSHLKFFLKFSGDPRKPEDMTPAQCLELAKRPYIWKSCDYSTAVATLQRSLSQNELQIAFYEEIHADPGKWLYDLEDFLRVRHINYPVEKLKRRVNTSSSTQIPEFFEGLFAEEFRRQYASLCRMGLSIPMQWTKL